VEEGSEVAEFLGTQYLAVQPFADETALLEKISWSADRCIRVDAYWRVLGDVVFVEMVSAANDKHRVAGTYVRSSEGLNLVFVMASATITRTMFEHELGAIMRDDVLEKLLESADALGPFLVPLAQAVQPSPKVG